LTDLVAIGGRRGDLAVNHGVDGRVERPGGLFDVEDDAANRVGVCEGEIGERKKGGR
jgi:hypothetical protein